MHENLFAIIIYSLIYIFPAYVANGAPVIFGGGKPLDFGRKFMGKRILGSSKTIKGAVAGIMAGTIIGIVEYNLFPYMLCISVALAFGAIFGDALGSFIKRRIDLKPGATLPIFDQYGFLAFALLFALPLGHLPNLYGLLFIVILTGPLHLFTNICANRLKLKSVPW